MKSLATTAVSLLLALVWTLEVQAAEISIELSETLYQRKDYAIVNQKKVHSSDISAKYPPKLSTTADSIMKGTLIEYEDALSPDLDPKFHYVVLIQYEEFASRKEVISFGDIQFIGVLLYTEQDTGMCEDIAKTFYLPCIQITNDEGVQLDELAKRLNTDSLTDDDIEENSTASLDPQLLIRRVEIDLNILDIDSVGNHSSGGSGVLVPVLSGVLGGALLIAVLGVCARLVFVRRRTARMRAERRNLGIQTLEERLEKEKVIQPLDSSLLKHLQVIDTKKQDISKLAQLIPNGSSDENDTDYGVIRLDMDDEPPPTRAVSGEDKDSSIETSLPPWNSALNEKAKEVGPVAADTVDANGSKSIPMTDLPKSSATLKESEVKESPNTCAVCIDEIERGQLVRQLPCNHLFHLECIDEWLTEKSGVCPLCKFNCTKYCVEKAGPDYTPPKKPKKDMSDEDPIYIY
ncbi:hypothetical protein IWQ61_000860 [Dispira simplex]|nr:hypothetical protein IWQ61_000860 [Dispira simplex]